MLLSVLLVNYNGKHHLQDCLDSLQSQAFRDFETVMVDNGSKDGSVTFVRERFPWVKVVESGKNLGFAGGNNFGLPHCGGDYVFLLNNDTRMDPSTLGALADGIRAHPGVKVFQAFMIDFHKPDRVDSAGDTLYTAGVPFNFAGFPATRFAEPRKITSACGGAAVFERSLLNRLGGFDEDFFLIFEDVDLSLRARHLGEEIVFLPDAKVHHKGSASLGGKRSSLSFYYSERNFLLLLLKNFPLGSLARTLPRHLVLKALRFFHALRLGCGGAWLRANRDVIAMIPRALAQRKAIMGSSRLTGAQFSALLRRHWLRERLALARKDYDLPL